MEFLRKPTALSEGVEGQPHCHMCGGTFVADRELISRSNKQETEMPIILWLLGVPLGLVVVLWLLHVI